MNCCVAPLAIDGLAGVTAIDFNVAAVTVSTSTGDVTPLSAAVMLLVPTPAPVANPVVVIVAVVVVAEFHVTVLVMFAVEASLYVPVAVNCWLPPAATDGFAGVTAIDCSVAAVTVSTSAGDVTPLSAAVMLLVPTPAPVARPPAVIVAVVVVAEFHVTVLVMFAVELSLYVPVAVNWCVAPLAIDGVAGVTAIDTSVAAVTVSTSAGEVTPLSAALMSLVPTPAPVARPVVVIVAVVVVAEFHVTVLVMFASCCCRCKFPSP